MNNKMVLTLCSTYTLVALQITYLSVKVKILAVHCCGLWEFLPCFPFIHTIFTCRSFNVKGAMNGILGGCK